MTRHFNILVWEIPGTEEPGRLQSMESQRVRHNLATSLLLFTFLHWRRKWAAIYEVTQSQTQLMLLSSSSKGVIDPVREILKQF